MDLELVNTVLAQNPYDQFMQFHAIRADEQSTVLVFRNDGKTWDNPNGTLYGGVLYSMADSAMELTCAVFGKAVLTMDLSMNYLRPAFSDSIIEAHVKLIHNGRSSMVALCDFYDDKERYLAHGKGTFFVTGPYALPEGGEGHGN